MNPIYRRSILAGGVLMLAACSSWEPIRIANDTPQQLQQESDQTICVYAYFSPTFSSDASKEVSEKVLQEGIRRGLIRPDWADEIRHNKASIGMNEYEAKAAWGFPLDVNTTTTAAGQQQQWVYGHYSDAMSFIYVQDGLVTAIQN
jgi:hypothetical protein